MALDDHPIGADPNAGPLFTNQMHWGHSASYDLINWIPLDLAIAPTESFDINSCWSGSATILPGNKPVIFYTGIDSEKRQVQNLAVPKVLSDPYLREWVKYTGNPPVQTLFAIEEHCSVKLNMSYGQTATMSVELKKQTRKLTTQSSKIDSSQP
ncbi:Glycosyl hydrolase family 32, N-terminal [Cynara cardunculus var. scolymus]|uniref:Glycosyl hydrolase family 32, N-terminal n=1 Tax=Cynara cardunculus var. scolymus TaxID=59895 RepID=A0A103XB64_CYNCS|nr:Glycosyl hydrolase family 32, N-terminal [Cynara cardunculus var. scolymus]